MCLWLGLPAVQPIAGVCGYLNMGLDSTITSVFAHILAPAAHCAREEFSVQRCKQLHRSMGHRSIMSAVVTSAVWCSARITLAHGPDAYRTRDDIEIHRAIRT